MLRRSLLLAALLVTLTVGGTASGTANAATAGLTVLTTAATDGKSSPAKFAVGLTIDGGKSWQSSANLNQTVTIKGSIDPDPAHVGKKGDVFVVQFYGGQFTMLTAANAWVAWDGKVGSLQPYLDDAMLTATQEVTIYQGGISTEGKHDIYIGYLSSVTSAPLVYSGTPASFQFNTAPVDPLAYFTTNVFQNIIVDKTCIICHNDTGLASTSRLHFINDSTKVQQNFDIFNNFYKSLGSDGYNYVLTKVSGGNNHGGGIPLPLGSSGYQTMAGFLDLLDGATKVNAITTADLLAGVSTQSATDTLRDASLLLAGRLPTASEITTVTAGGDAALKPVLLAMMQGTHFHKFLKDSADDRLFLRGNEDPNLADDCQSCFPAINAQYWAYKDAGNNAALGLWMNQLNYSLMESPLELIAYVVEHDKPYSEILTADYDMLTPVLNAVVGGTATFPAGASNTDFAPGKFTYYLRDSGTVLVPVIGAQFPRITTAPKLSVTYPQVGLLNSKSFLSRYPSTATNRNRARARWTYYNFLGIDIESLAKRTTDPVALADTNNPTMNNPACTVCHSVLDPVAGTFQDYFDNGIYRASLNGTDSLDGAYKRQKNPTLYVNCDTWYSDMRDPGFEGATAPAVDCKLNGANSLRWLADLIVKDKRFATATVRFWWPAVISSDLLKAPEATEDANYQAKLSAYEGQQAEIAALTDKFMQSGLSVKNLLAELVLSKWYRADKLTGTSVSAVASDARSLALLSGEKLLTPEQLSRKTKALTGFNWNAQVVATTGDQLSGLENDYNTFYGGIDGFALKVRARMLTPMMSNVATSHAMESSCPIVLGDFIRLDTQRMLFGGLSPWVTPLTEQSVSQLMSSTSDTDYRSYSFQATLQSGIKQLVVSLLNDGCDYSTSASTCKADKNLVINTLTVTKPGGQVTVFNGNSGTYGSCAAVLNSTRLKLYSSCSATFNYVADQSGTYTITASLAAQQQATDPVLAGINIESTDAASTANTAGAAQIKNKLVELYSKLLGQTVTVTSPEVLASYDLLVQTWQSRKAANSTPSLLQSKTLACDWSTDIGFVGTLGYPGSPLKTNGKYDTTPVTNWLNPQAQDPLWMKQSWVVVMAYLLSHYDYLHE